jgi:hypothetical protein
MERQMTEAVTITNEELAILCDIVAGWSVKKAESLDRDKQQALHRLIAYGFVEQANGRSVAKYQHTATFHPTLRRNKWRVNASVPTREVTAAARFLSRFRLGPCP